MQVEAYLKTDDRCVLPLGSTEQHAYISLATDSILSERLALEAAEPLESVPAKSSLSGYYTCPILPLVFSLNFEYLILLPLHEQHPANQSPLVLCLSK